MRREPPRLHAVTTDAILARPDLAAVAARLAAAGPVALHVRGRHTSARRRAEITARFAGAGAVVLVNDRADLAFAARAHGVHLPARGLPIAAARRLLGPDALIGRSTHAPEEARRAHDEGADYVFLGPIWQTASHPDRAPLGPQAIAAARPARVIAIGGITPARVAECLAAGAFGVAAIRALWDADDPGSAARTMLVCLGKRIAGGDGGGE